MWLQMQTIVTNPIRLNVMEDIEQQLEEEFELRVEGFIPHCSPMETFQMKLIVLQSVAHEVKWMQLGSVAVDARKDNVYIQPMSGSKPIRIPVQYVKTRLS